VKPRVFIGSSSEGLDVARAIARGLKNDCLVVPWTAGVFAASETYIESLEKAIDRVEFAVLVVTPDDIREKRKVITKVPRDNVVFEAGLFMGRLGRKRAFIVCDPKEVELPTDLLGLSPISFDSKLDPSDLGIQLQGVASFEILDSIKQAPRRITADVKKASSHLLWDEHALYDTLVSWPVRPGVQVVAQTPDTAWATRIFPTLLHWRLNKAQVRILVQAPSPLFGRAERARRDLLNGIGVEVCEVAAPSMFGFFLSTRYPEDNVAVILNGLDNSAPGAVKYAGPDHLHAIEALHRLIPTADEPQELHAPTLVKQEVDPVRELLREVDQYGSPKVEIEAATLKTRDLKLTSPYAHSYKYQQISRLLDAYENVAQEPFTALAVHLASGSTSIVTPPVVEERAEGLVVIEGTTRAAYCFKNGIDEYHCLRVRGVEQDLPGRPIAIGDVKIRERSLNKRERSGMYSERYRKIERAVHPY